MRCTGTNLGCTGTNVGFTVRCDRADGLLCAGTGVIHGPHRVGPIAVGADQDLSAALPANTLQLLQTSEGESNSHRTEIACNVPFINILHS